MTIGTKEMSILVQKDKIKPETTLSSRKANEITSLNALASNIVYNDKNKNTACKIIKQLLQLPGTAVSDFVQKMFAAGSENRTGQKFTAKVLAALLSEAQPQKQEDAFKLGSCTYNITHTLAYDNIKHLLLDVTMNNPFINDVIEELIGKNNKLIGVFVECATKGLVPKQNGTLNTKQDILNMIIKSINERKHPLSSYQKQQILSGITDEEHRKQVASKIGVDLKQQKSN